MKTFKLDLTSIEKKWLKQNRLKISVLAECATDEIAVLLNASEQRAAEIRALISFQTIPSIGPKFAHDLISLGYYGIRDLQGKDGPTLFNDLTRKQGYWIDPCVEDQCWLAVHYAHHPGSNKKWWDFTKDRKTYRTKHDYS